MKSGKSLLATGVIIEERCNPLTSHGAGVGGGWPEVKLSQAGLTRSLAGVRVRCPARPSGEWLLPSPELPGWVRRAQRERMGTSRMRVDVQRGSCARSLLCCF